MNTKEVLEALCAGKNIRDARWHPDYYIYMDYFDNYIKWKSGELFEGSINSPCWEEYKNPSSERAEKQKQMNTYDNIQEVFTALANGKKIRKQDWIKNTYISLHENFIVWTHSNKQTDEEYIGSFGGSWEEYIEEELSFDDLEVGKTYMRTDVEECNSFMVLYKTKNLFVARYNNNEDEVCYYKYDYTTYKQV